MLRIRFMLTVGAGMRRERGELKGAVEVTHCNFKGTPGDWVMEHLSAMLPQLSSRLMTQVEISVPLDEDRHIQTEREERQRPRAIVVAARHRMLHFIVRSDLHNPLLLGQAMSCLNGSGPNRVGPSKPFFMCHVKFKGKGGSHADEFLLKSS